MEYGAYDVAQPFSLSLCVEMHLIFRFESLTTATHSRLMSNYALLCGSWFLVLFINKKFVWNLRTGMVHNDSAN